MTDLPIIGFHVNDGTSPWAEPDAEWFRNHPGETVMIRPAIPGELGPYDTSGLFVEVRQLRAGQRTRRPLFGGGAA